METLVMGFLGWLGILFIALKLTGYIEWSWALVTLPIYGVFILALILTIFSRVKW
jgi:hypothetical protein